MIDSHCHLDHEPLFSNINEILSRSKKVGIKKLLTISTNLESYKNITGGNYLRNAVVCHPLPVEQSHQ